MGRFAIPIQGAGLGDQQAFGTNGISNASPTISAQGIPAPDLSRLARVYDSVDSGAVVDFSFKIDYQESHPLNTAFVFGEGQVVAAVSANDTYRSGFAAIDNSAHTIAPNGFDSLRSRGTVVWNYVENGGGSVVFSFDDEYIRQSRLNTPFYFGGSPTVAGVTAGDISRYSVGAIVKSSGRQIRPESIVAGSSTFGVPRVGETGGIYIDFDGDYNKPSRLNVPFYFGSGLALSATAGIQSHYGSPWIENAAATLAPKGWDSFSVSKKTILSFEGEDGASAGLLFSGEYTNRPSALNVPFYFAGQLNPWITGFDSLTTGSPYIYHLNRGIAPTGQDYLDVGLPNLRLTAQPVVVGKGIKDDAYGRPYLYNLLQFVYSRGFNASEVSREVFVGGGVKYLNPRGINQLTFGSVKVINTTASQYARPQGIPAIALPMPSVSPRILHVKSVYGTSFGLPLAQFPPQPKGWLSSSFGYPSIEYRTKWVQPGGIGADEQFGYPAVFDPTQTIHAYSVAQAGVFGDTAIKNVRFVIEQHGFDSLEMSSWAELRNTRRHVQVSGWVSTAFGDSWTWNKTPSITPLGFDALGMAQGGEVGVGYAIRYVYVRGFDLLGIGRATLTKTPSLSPSGFDSARIGAQTVWPRVRTLEVRGADSYRSGRADVWFRYRHIELEGRGIDGSDYGKPRFDHEHRELLTRGSDFAAVGRPVIGQRNRTIEPASIWEDFATGHMVGGLRFLRPVGYEATRWGTRIIPEITQVYARGFANEYGLPQIINLTSLVAPDSIRTTPDPVDQWGKAKVWNSIQHITMFYDVDSELNPPAWPQWTMIENRNKVMRATGHVMTAMGRLVIANKATGVYPDGIAAPDSEPLYESGMVAFRVRPLRLEGLEPPYMSSWVSVYNDAAVLSPKEFNAELFGNAALENTRRTFRFQGWDSAWLGYPMVADRVRTIDIERRYGIAPPIIRMPEVKLYTRYIEPAGYEPWGIGAQSLSIHWTKITPRWTHQDMFGEGRVHNVTPELRTRGRNSEEFGNTFVRLEWREVITGETFTQIIPRPIIAYRDRLLPVVGIQSMIVSDKLVVTKTGAPPYSDQYINLEGSINPDNGERKDDGDGIPPPGTSEIPQVPKPIINQQVLYHYHYPDRPMTVFGQHRITANTIRVEPGFQELSVGEPAVGLRIRTLVVAEFKKDQVYEPSKARVSPHTIWAVLEAPEQARKNHPVGRQLHAVRGWMGFGRVSVSLRHRIVRQSANNNGYGNNMARFGRAELHSTLHYIRPSSFYTFRSGWHTIPGDHISEQMPTASTLAFGRPVVSFPPYVGPQTVKPRAFDACTFGRLLIEFKNRPIYPTGYLATLMGTRKKGDSPYMWQGLRVGELMPTIPNGFNSEAMGESWVSFRVREVKPEGFDAFLCEYDLTAFAKRMRVWRPEVPNEVTSINPDGFDALVSGTPNARPHVHYIRPDGNSDQYRKGAF